MQVYLNDEKLEVKLQWKFTSVNRDGRPNLDFIGRSIFTIVTVTDFRDKVSICLWERRQGGYALSWTTLLDNKISQQCAVMMCLSDVMDHIEDICASLLRQSNRWTETFVPSPNSLMVFIADLQRHTNFQRIFAAVAGEALAHCDKWNSA